MWLSVHQQQFETHTHTHTHTKICVYPPSCWLSPPLCLLSAETRTNPIERYNSLIHTHTHTHQHTDTHTVLHVFPLFFLFCFLYSQRYRHLPPSLFHSLSL